MKSFFANQKAKLPSISSLLKELPNQLTISNQVKPKDQNDEDKAITSGAKSPSSKVENSGDPDQDNTESSTEINSSA